jgi:hypothetical protein
MLKISYTKGYEDMQWIMWLRQPLVKLLLRLYFATGPKTLLPGNYLLFSDETRIQQNYQSVGVQLEIPQLAMEEPDRQCSPLRFSIARAKDTVKKEERGKAVACTHAFTLNC